MRRSAVLLSSLLAYTAAHSLPEIHLQKRDRHTNGRTANVARGVVARADGDGVVETSMFDVATWSAGGAYYANISVGTPAQPQVVLLDTGSSDLYFDASTASECSLAADDPNSCQGGTFNPDNSTSYKIAAPAPAFNTSFGDGSTAQGPFGRDVVCIADVCIDNVQFGVATTIDSTVGFAIGLMGVGYSFIEAVTDHRYPNMPEVLVDANVINSRLYSIYLNSEEEVSGSILFGGIDTSKYTGDLVTLNLLPDFYQLQRYDESVVTQFVTVVTSVSANTDATGNQDQVLISGTETGPAAYVQGNSLPMLLDTGTAAWQVPRQLYRDYIIPAFPYVDSSGLCDCSHATNSESMTLVFGDAVSITIPASEFIVPYYNTTTQEPVPYDSDGNDACIFMVAPAPEALSSQGFGIAGDAIMRSMYVVFDLDNAQVSIAQAAVNSTASPDVHVVKAGANGVANAVSVANNPSRQPAIPWPGINATVTFSASTMESTLGQATGIDAVPEEARPDDNGAAGIVGTSVSVWAVFGVTCLAAVAGMGLVL